MRRHRNVIDRGFVIAVLAKALEGGIDDLDLLLLIECKKFLQYAHILSITESVTICIVARITESVNIDFDIFQQFIKQTEQACSYLSGLLFDMVLILKFYEQDILMPFKCK